MMSWSCRSQIGEGDVRQGSRESMKCVGMMAGDVELYGCLRECSAVV